MKGIILPKVIIHDTLVSIIKLIREDLANATSDEETILYRLYGYDIDWKPIHLNAYGFFKQAKEIFSNIKNLEIRFGYNPEVARPISLCILLPGEEYGSGYIGQDEGTPDEYDVQGQGGDITTDLGQTQFYQATYQIMITSENNAEVEVVYDVLKSMLLTLTAHLELMGLRIPKFAGHDIVFQDDTIPAGLFHKILSINFQYELTVPQLVRKDIIKKFTVISSILNLQTNNE